MQEIKNFIAQLVDFFKQKKDVDKNFFIFLENFYSQNKVRDFAEYKTEDLGQQVTSAYKFFLNKPKCQFKIEIYNQSSLNYTVLDIVNDDMPFLVDSIALQLDQLGIEIKNIIHPIYFVERDGSGDLKQIHSSKNQSTQKDSLIQIHIEKIEHQEVINNIKEHLTKLLNAVRVVVDDFDKMNALLNTAKKHLNKDSKNYSEISDFIDWVSGGHFIFLGAREYDVSKKSGFEAKNLFGVCKLESVEFSPKNNNISKEDAVYNIDNPYFLEVSKSRYKSQIHRIANTERIRIQKFSSDGKVIGECRFFGLFTSSAYNQSANLIPVVKDKIAKVITDSGFLVNSHNYKDLVSILESYPKDELFQIEPKDLLAISTAVVAICGRPQIRFFARPDKFGRFMNCLIFLPKDRNDADFRAKVKVYLAKTYNGEVTDSDVGTVSSNLIRFQVIIRTNNVTEVGDLKAIEQEITKMARLWSDDLKQEIAAIYTGDLANLLFSKYKNVFSSSYKNRFSAATGALDIKKIEESLEKNTPIFNLHKSSSLPKEVSELKIYSPQKEIILSEIMPVVESFGFRMIHENTYSATFNNEQKVWIHYFQLNLSKELNEFSLEIKKNFEEVMLLVFNDVVTYDFLNQLIVAANFNWRQIYLLRSYLKYIYQTGFRYNEKYIADTLVKYHKITALLVSLFETKFDPAKKLTAVQRGPKIAIIIEDINQELNKISNLLEDSIVRKFLVVINATLRTNYYQLNQNGAVKNYLSFKFDDKKIPDLPLPLPYAEIFVYSKSFEAIHLRGGKVARGGLRWSDRYEDYRTEVLGLMKAQMTKNAVIVPVGSKGGFVVKASTSSIGTKQYQEEGIECYKNFLRGMLDITDNVIAGEIIQPKNTVIYDDNDPYLVVAADKGTASFSDIANSISAEYNFWLGDAFASGGSCGYDHKKMAITSRGAWISVARHFNEADIDIQNQDFTCVGIGDMSGDVFGNGMLCSKKIRLIAAFNHVHIFLDPNPDSSKSFIERQRLFNLERSTWLDYDKKLISEGGGIFARSEKSIKLSLEVQKSLGIMQDVATPDELIRAILKAPVDLLWNGGIGTYVKATDESNQDVGDKVNDQLRINGAELRCKIVGEGGNLGFTQKGRIEYALHGGRINTDAIDNSAGVDCSDHEVNIKIALSAALKSKKITFAERNEILGAMTEEVGKLVLNDNLLQTAAITIAAKQGYIALTNQEHFLNALEKIKLLNRKVEFLPSNQEIAKRKTDKIGMTRPELCVMLSYAKIHLYNQIVNSNLADDPYFERELISYFPKIIQERFRDEILNHQLRREIICTELTNFIVNHAGIVFVNQLCQDTGFSVINLVKAFIVACDVFGLKQMWDDLENLNGKIAHHILMQIFADIANLLERSVVWLLQNHIKIENSIVSIVTEFKPIADNLLKLLPDVLVKPSRDLYLKRIERYCLNNVDKQLAIKISALDAISSTFDIAKISFESSLKLESIARIYFIIGNRFNLSSLRKKIAAIAFNNYYQALSVKVITEDLYTIQMNLAKKIIDSKSDIRISENDMIDNWIKDNHDLMVRFDNFITDLKLQSANDISFFVVIINRFKSLVAN